MNGSLVINDFNEFVVRKDDRNSEELFRSYDRAEAKAKAKSLGKNRLYREHFTRRMADVWYNQRAHCDRVTDIQLGD